MVVIPTLWRVNTRVNKERYHMSENNQMTQYEEAMLANSQMMLAQVTRIGDLFERLCEPRAMLPATLAENVNQDVVIDKEVPKKRNGNRTRKWTGEKLAELMAAYDLGGMTEVDKLSKIRHYNINAARQMVYAELRKREAQKFLNKLKKPEEHEEHKEPEEEDIAD
jgi:hypothetical protein